MLVGVDIPDLLSESQIQHNAWDTNVSGVFWKPWGFAGEIQSHDGFDAYATRFQTTSKQPKDTLKKNSRQVFDNGFVLFLFPCPLKTTSFTKKKVPVPMKKSHQFSMSDFRNQFPRCREVLKLHSSPGKTHSCAKPCAGVVVRLVRTWKIGTANRENNLCCIFTTSNISCLCFKQGNSHKNDGAVAHLCPHRSKCKSSQSPNVLATVLCHSGRDPL